MISVLAAFTRPATASEVNVDAANRGTLTGALCFAIGGVMQGFDRQPRRRDDVRSARLMPSGLRGSSNEPETGNARAALFSFA